MTASTPKFLMGKAWRVTIVNILGSAGFGFGLYKAMTTMTLIITYFDTDYTTYGTCTGLVALLALITAIPGGMILGKIGARNLSLACFATAVLGNIISVAYMIIAGPGCSFVVYTLCGAVSMLGWGAVSVAGTMLVNCWFPPQKRSLPMGCCGLFVPISLCCILLFSTPLINMASTDGWTAEQLEYCYGQSPGGVVTVNVAIMIYVIIMFILALFFIRLPKPENSFLGLNAASEAAGEQAMDQSEGRNIDGFTNLGVWLFVIVFCCYTCGSTTYANYFPTYIEADASMGGFSIPVATANLYSQCVTFSMIAVSLILGYALTKIKRDYWWILILIVVCCICFNNTFLFRVPTAGFIIPLLCVYGCTQELWPCVTYTIIPELCDSPKELGTALGLVSFMMNLAGTLINSLNGVIIDNQVYTGAGWNALATPLTIFGFIALIVGIILIFVWRKRWNVLKARAAEFTASQQAAA